MRKYRVRIEMELENQSMDWAAQEAVYKIEIGAWEFLEVEVTDIEEGDRRRFELENADRPAKREEPKRKRFPGW